MDRKVIKTDCILCVWGCGINAYVEDGRLVKVEGMAEHPLNQGVLCPKGENLVDYIYSPDRLKYPMKRADGGWERISWDDALDTIAGKLQRIKDEYGAHALAIFCGSVGVENNELAAKVGGTKAVLDFLPIMRGVRIARGAKGAAGGVRNGKRGLAGLEGETLERARAVRVCPGSRSCGKRWLRNMPLTLWDTPQDRKHCSSAVSVRCFA